MARRFLLSLPLSYLAAGALAQSATAAASSSTSVVDLTLPMVHSQALVGSLIGTDATATSYHIACPSPTALTCGVGPNGADVVEGDSVLEFHMTHSVAGTIDIECDVASNTAICTTSATTLDYTVSNTLTVSSMATSTGTATITDVSSSTIPVTITAGLDTQSATAVATSAAGSSRTRQDAILAGAVMALGCMLLI